MFVVTELAEHEKQEMQKDDARSISRENLKPGDLLKNTWGATIRRTNFWQVIEVDGTRVKLGVPETESNGMHEGHQWIVRRAKKPEHVRNAKFTASGLKLCRRQQFEVPGPGDWKVSDMYWDKLERARPMEKEYFHGD